METGSNVVPSTFFEPLVPPRIYTDTSKTELTSPDASPASRSPAAVPWYRQPKWIIVFILGCFACVAAIVGGAVGGTMGHGSHRSANATQPRSGGSSSNDTNVGSDEPNSTRSSVSLPPDSTANSTPDASAAASTPYTTSNIAQRSSSRHFGRRQPGSARAHTSSP